MGFGFECSITRKSVTTENCEKCRDMRKNRPLCNEIREQVRRAFKF